MNPHQPNTTHVHSSSHRGRSAELALVAWLAIAGTVVGGNVGVVNIALVTSTTTSDDSSAETGRSPAEASKVESERPEPPELPDDNVPPQAAATESELLAWINGLDDPDFAVRETAQVQLVRAGHQAIPMLEKVANSGSLEQTARSVRVLGKLGDSGDTRTFEEVELALERLSRSKSRSVTRRAQQQLDRLSDARTRHAIARFESLGGRMKKVFSQNIGGTELRARQAVLNRKWKGTDKDLVLLTRISGLETLYVTRSAPVTAASLEQLKLAMRTPLQIQPRGDSMVGIQAGSQDDECLVSGVEADSPADRAGIRQGDVIVTYNGEKLLGFDRLVEITRELTPGTKVRLEVMRRGTPREIELELADFE